MAAFPGDADAVRLPFGVMRASAGRTIHGGLPPARALPPGGANCGDVGAGALKRRRTEGSGRDRWRRRRRRHRSRRRCGACADAAGTPRLRRRDVRAAHRACPAVSIPRARTPACVRVSRDDASCYGSRRFGCPLAFTAGVVARGSGSDCRRVEPVRRPIGLRQRGGRVLRSDRVSWTKLHRTDRLLGGAVPTPQRTTHWLANGLGRGGGAVWSTPRSPGSSAA